MSLCRLAGTEIAVLTKIFSAEAAVQVVYDAMRLVGIESYTEPARERCESSTDTQPFAELLRDALAYPLFDGGNVGRAASVLAGTVRYRGLRPAGRRRQPAAAELTSGRPGRPETDLE